MDLLTIIPAFLVTIGVLVTVHEFGHFWVARKLGVKVLRFSIGFGRPLWRKVSGDDQIEYVIAALPLGGYVKMLDEREGEVPPEDAHRAFNRQPVWTRIAVVFAGPAANFLLAIVIYALTFMIGVDAMRPFVEARQDTPAAVAGFKPGDRITSINGAAVDSWEDARMLLLEDYLRNPVLSIGVEMQDGSNAIRSLDLQGESLLKSENDFLDKAGLKSWAPEYGVAVAKVLPNTPAEHAGLRAGDKILQVDDFKPEGVEAFVDYIRRHPGETLAFQIERDGVVLDVNITPEVKQEDGKRVGGIGAAIGLYLPESAREKLFFTQSYNPLQAVVRGAEKTWQMSAVTLKLMGRMLTGDVALKNISGPLTIARYAGETASIGPIYFLGFLAIVSVSLGVLNLLPIPMLDGGHLLYYLVELIKGSPVSEAVEAVGLRIGIGIIGALMVLAIYNDFMRLMN